MPNQIFKIREEDKTSVDRIIEQLGDQLKDGTLKPGDRLPAERKFAEQLGVGRAYVRSAFKKLEFYGIVRTMPQSGSYIASLEMPVLEGMMSDVLVMGEEDFFSLAEMRIMLESNSARLAAERCTDEDIISIATALEQYNVAYEAGGDCTEEDFVFHRAISNASKNSVLKSMQLLISPNIMRYYANNNTLSNREKTHLEHNLIFENIKKGNSIMVCELMKVHLQDVADYAEKLNNKGFRILR